MARRIAVGLAVLALTGCGGGAARAPAVATPVYPPTAAEPGRAPVPSVRPAGRVVKVGRAPEGVAFDPKTGLVAVGVDDPAQLVLLDRDGAVRRRVPLPGAPRHLSLARPGGPVLVPAEAADELVEVSLPGGGTRATKVGDQPHDATAIGDRYFVADELGSTMSVVQDGKLRAQVPVDVQPGGIVAVGGKVAVISVQAYTLERFDARTLAPEGSRNAGIGPTHAVADREGRIYVADTRGGAVIVYETTPRLRWVGRIQLGGSPLGLATDDARGRVWVTLSGVNQAVAISEAPHPRRLETVPTVRQPNSLAVDPGSGRLFIASRTDGTLQLADPR